ncbi:hypothetical protein LEL_06748 [Akanthomyces lecanii RCEF 1005]|uniref:Nucleotide-binding, alpha-beta plait n=1 Tax=Akanthomyces lecanii RCEF 1005 TaxID=1081108 RepID=A0A168GY23_CORDF|nr:hypothetical protein LEL_06748 [Akanthomyces lecanii RCEF 1005]
MSSTKEEGDPPRDVPAPLSLTYHTDIELVRDFKICRGNITSSSTMDSRRILFYNLPPSITALQVARAAAAFGQVLLVNAVAPVVRGTNNGSMTMLVEFATSESSEMCRLAVNSTCPIFLSGTGELYAAGVWVVPTPSFPICCNTDNSLNRGYTRTVAIFPISVNCVWFIIHAVAAPQDILAAEYDAATETLTLEFASVGVAHRTSLHMNNNLFDFVFEGRAAVRRLESREDRVGCGCYVAYVPPDVLQQQFDRSPFNEYWPERYYYVMTQRNLHPRTAHKKRNISASDATTTDDDSFETTSSVETSLDEEPRERPQIRHTLSSKKQKQAPEVLLVELEDSKLSGSWDSFFENRHTISLRGWDEYGKIARHRRELTSEQGLVDGIVPKCDGKCELKCKGIKETPPPDDVDKFLAQLRDDLLIDV